MQHSSSPIIHNKRYKNFLQLGLTNPTLSLVLFSNWGQKLQTCDAWLMLRDKQLYKFEDDLRETVTCRTHTLNFKIMTGFQEESCGQISSVKK